MRTPQASRFRRSFTAVTRSTLLALVGSAPFAGAADPTLDAPTSRAVPVVITGHKSAIRSIVFDGTDRIRTLSFDAAITWNLRTGGKLETDGQTDPREGGVADPSESESGRQLVLPPAVGADGRQLLTGSGWADCRSWLWERRTGKPVWERVRPFDGYPLALSPEGKRVLTCTAPFGVGITAEPVVVQASAVDGSNVGAAKPAARRTETLEPNVILLWEGTTGKLIHRLRGHRSAISAAAFSANGAWLFTGTEDGTCLLWHATTGKLVRSFEATARSITACRFSRDGRYVSVSTAPVDAKGGFVGRYGFQNGIRAIPVDAGGGGFGGGVGGVGGIAAGQFGIGGIGGGIGGAGGFGGGVVFGDNGGFQGRVVIDSETGKPFRGEVIVWDLNSGRTVATLRMRDTEIFDHAISADGTRVIAGETGRAVLWNVSTGKVEQVLNTVSSKPLKFEDPPDADRLTGEDAVRSVAFSPEGESVATGSSDGSLQLWNVADGARIRRFGHRAELASSSEFNPVSATLLTSHSDDIAVWDLIEGRRVRSLRESLPVVQSGVRIPVEARFSPDGRWILAQSGWSPGNLTSTLIEAKTGTWTSRFDGCGTASFTRDGRRLLIDDELIDVETGKTLRSFEKPVKDQNIEWIAFRTALPCPDGRFSADGRKIAIASQHGMRICNVETGAELIRFLILDDGEHWLAVTPNGDFIGSEGVEECLDWELDGHPVSAAERIRLGRESRKSDRVRDALR